MQPDCILAIYPVTQEEFFMILLVQTKSYYNEYVGLFRQRPYGGSCLNFKAT